MKTAAIYARVSTDEQGKNTSLGGQFEACDQYAAEHGYTVVKRIREEYSGARLDRPGLIDIRDMVSAGQLAAVIAYDPDRLSRSSAHMWILMEEFERQGVQMLFVNAPPEDTSEGRMLFGMKALFAEYERAKIADRTQQAKERCARAGQVLSSAACSYGYKYVTEPGPPHYEVNEEEAVIVRRIFQWLAHERLTLGRMCTRLHDAGVPTKRGGTWTRSTLRGIIMNESYIGTFYWRRHKSVLPRNGKEGRKTEKSSHVLRDRSEWIAVPVPPIVHPETFAAAQVQLQQNKEMSARNARREYLLRGMCYCGLCGRKMHGTVRHYETRLYRCKGQSNDASIRGDEPCKSKQQKADVIEARAWAALVDYITRPGKVAKGIEGEDKALSAGAARDDNTMKSIHSLIEGIEREEARLLKTYQQEVIELPMLQEGLAQIRKRKQGFQTELEAVQARIEQRGKRVANLATLQELSRRAGTGLRQMNSQQRRDVLEVLNARIQIFDDRLEITGLITDKLTVLLEEAGKGRSKDTESGGNGQLRTQGLWPAQGFGQRA